MALENGKLIDKNIYDFYNNDPKRITFDSTDSLLPDDKNLNGRWKPERSWDPVVDAKYYLEHPEQKERADKLRLRIWNCFIQSLKTEIGSKKLGILWKIADDVINNFSDNPIFSTLFKVSLDGSTVWLDFTQKNLITVIEYLRQNSPVINAALVNYNSETIVKRLATEDPVHIYTDFERKYVIQNTKSLFIKTMNKLRWKCMVYWGRISSFYKFFWIG